MRKSFLLFLILFIGTISNSNFAQIKESDIWSRIQVDPKSEVNIPNDYIYTPAPQLIRRMRLIGSEAIIYPNFRPRPTTNTTQSEMSVDIHPLNSNIIFSSANATPYPVAGIYGTGCYFTTDGGQNWGGFDNPPFGANSGDPASVIGTNGYFFEGFIDGGSNDGGQGVAVSSDNGGTWSRYVVAAAPPGYSDLLDKNHMWIDKKVGSPFENRVYAAWTDFYSGNANNYAIGFKYSSNNGATWSPQKNISVNLPNSYLDQGVNIATGPNGEVYAAWAVYVDNSVSTGEDGIGFNVSTDGGETWGTPRLAYNKTNFGIRGNLSNKNNIRVSSFPSMSVNRSTGEIYIVFPQKGNVAPSGNSIDIVMIKSTDGGNTWTTGVRVNDDPLNNSKDQYYPWCTVDPSTGGLHVVFYDSRNVQNDSAEVYMASSIDGGNTFENFKVSDAKFKPKTISGLASGYQGDYIGITALNNNVYPYWCDDRTGIYQGWMTKVVVATYPLNAFNLINPTANATAISFPNSATVYEATWDTSSSTASYKWIFGTQANPRMIVLPTSENRIRITAGQLDVLLEGLGVAQGDSIVGQWDVWAYRNNAPQNDSLKSANGPRSMTLKRGVPQLLPFSLVSPNDNSIFVTSSNNTSQIQIKWTRSGEGVRYKWKFNSPNFSGNNVFNLLADNNGYDTALTIQNNVLDALLTGIGLSTGDSVIGQWRVFAFRNSQDSLGSSQTYNIILKRQSLGEFLVVYDSTSSNGRISKDSVLSVLNNMGKTYDLKNKGSNSSTITFSMKGYKTVVWLGAGTSCMSLAQKDSIKKYLISGGTTPTSKSKLIIFNEDLGYNLDRSGSTNIDTTFARSTLGFVYVLDRPSTGANQGLINLITGKTDSTVGTWPDVIKHSTYGNTYSLYRFRGINSSDSVNSIGKIGTTYNSAVFCVDVHSLRNAVDGPGGSPISRFLERGLQFVDELVIPVELSSFNANVVENSVQINWTTATETNNLGFEIERKDNDANFKKIAFIKGTGTSTEEVNYSFTDKLVKTGLVVYRLKQIDLDGSVNYSDEIKVDVNIPLEFSLEQNYPNPFNPTTNIIYTIPQDGMVNLSIYNILGEKVATLINDLQVSGRYEINFDATRYSSGVYFYRLESGNNISIKKMSLIK